jgi:hypothetical protein
MADTEYVSNRRNGSLGWLYLYDGAFEHASVHLQAAVISANGCYHLGCRVRRNRIRAESCRISCTEVSGRSYRGAIFSRL